MIQPRALPHNLETEKALLGGLLLSPDLLVDIRMKIAPADFFSGILRPIYAAMLSLLDDANPIDVVTVADRLEKDGWLEKIGGPPTLMDLTQFVPTGTGAVFYADLLAALATRRRLIQTLGTLTEDAYDDATDADTLVSHAQETIYGLGEDADRKATTALKAAQAAKQLVMDAREGHLGLQTQHEALNRHTGGAYGGELIVIGGITGSGKSILLSNLAYEIAHTGRVAVFSFEMRPPRIALRRIANQGRIELYQLLRGEKLPYGYEERFEDAVKDVGAANLIYHDLSFRNIGRIRAVCRRYLRQEAGLKAVVVDYLQLCVSDDATSRDSRATRVGAVAYALKRLAMEMNRPVIVGAQLNREGVKRADPAPLLSDLRESGEIEHAADQIWLLHRPMLWPRPADQPNNQEWQEKATLRIAKARDNYTGDIEMQFLGAQMRFKEVEPKVKF